MKKIIAILLLLPLFLLSACSQMITIDQHVKIVKEQLPDNVKLVDSQKVYTTKKTFPDIMFVFSTPENSIIEVHQFNEGKDKWEVIYKDKTHKNYNGLENLSILHTSMKSANDTEHVYLGYRGGNGGFLNFYILGVDDKGEISQVFNKMINEFENSSIKVTEDGFDLFSDGVLVESYERSRSSYLLK